MSTERLQTPATATVTIGRRANSGQIGIEVRIAGLGEITVELPAQNFALALTGMTEVPATFTRHVPRRQPGG